MKEIDWDNKEQVLEAVKKWGLVLQCASERLQNDKEVVLEAVKESGWVLRSASKQLQKDKEIVLEAAKNLYEIKKNERGLIKIGCWEYKTKQELLKIKFEEVKKEFMNNEQLFNAFRNIIEEL